MQEILQQKLLSWTPEIASEFFNNLPRFGLHSDRIWELAPTGYFTWDPTFSGYFDNNGKSYTLVLGDKIDEYTIKQQLSNASTTIAIEKPTVMQPVIIEGITYTYIEQNRPFNSLGISVINLIQTPDNLDDAITKFIAKSFETAENYINLLDTVFNTPDATIYPYAIPVNSLYYDPATENYFLVGEFNHAYSRDEFITNTKTSFNEVEIHLSRFFRKSITLTQPLEDLLKLCPTFQQV
jgi:hypothetical protein